jgi:hypothetical protein
VQFDRKQPLSHDRRKEGVNVTADKPTPELAKPENPELPAVVALAFKLADFLNLVRIDRLGDIAIAVGGHRLR